MDKTTKKYDFDRVVRMTISVVCIVVAIYVINYLSPVLLPFLIGFLLAYILDPIVRFYQRLLHVKRRILPVMLTLLTVIVVLFTAGYFLVPYLVKEATDMTMMLKAYAESSFKISYIPAEVHEFLMSNIDFNSISELFSRDQWMKMLQSVMSGTWSVLGGTWSYLMSVVSSLIVLLYMVFVMLDFENLSRSFKAAIPRRYRYMSLRVLADVENTMSRYFRGQALVSLLVGIVFAIEFYIIGLPMAIVFGLSIGILNMVPYLQLLSIPVAAFLCLVASVATGGSFWVLFGWTIGAYCLCQLIQDFIFVPAIMKKQMGLNPAIVFLSLSLWSYVLGFVGLIVALPLTTLIISYYNKFVLHSDKTHKK
ncbi:MAG: AI-2E family transporter [Bacteroidales bacterium]|nr:AI-2E family transporter [Candidatus Sodaliphilus limicaballi]